MDKQMEQDLCHLFQCEDGVHQIDAICLVVRASQNRLTPQQRCIFDAVLSLFGKDMKKTVIPVITFSVRGKPAALAAINKFDFQWCRDKSNNPIYFQFDNTPEDVEDYDVSPKESKAAWDKRKQSLQAFFEYLNNLETRSLVMTHKVLFEREKLECCVQSLQDQIMQAEHKQNEIRQTQEALEKNKEEIQKNNNFEYVVEESFADKVESDTYATLCKKCQFTCHYPCSIFQDKIFWCAVTPYSDCISCPGKCSLSDHVTEKMRYVPKVRKVTRTLKKLKEKYEESSRGFESLQKMLQEELSEIEREKLRLIFESYNHIIRLHEIALRPESLSILPNIKFLIERLREINQIDKAQKLEDIQKRAMKAHNTEEGEQSRFMKFIASFYP
ncbi:uncharacterized protein LOC125719074 [Brienomyrus brachyistius]|uniref:uncharacterized protein LOC125719074 n=1 Tax=Brienomyrus brachyistius TaxID=42636 RepID=UPI0020B2CCB1|nr:uncharacterized protein LOC125719074 [Brienomyrus brachyistius]